MEGENLIVNSSKKESDIVFSKAIRAGKRIYYLDVKQNKNEEYFLTITESIKKIQNPETSAHVSFEKHKIFLYKEDIEKFMNGLQEVAAFIQPDNATKAARNATTAAQPQKVPKKGFFNRFRF